MRAPSVAPREADAVGSLKVCRGGTAVGETREEGGKFNSRVHAQHHCRGRTKHVEKWGSFNSKFDNKNKFLYN